MNSGLGPTPSYPVLSLLDNYSAEDKKGRGDTPLCPTPLWHAHRQGGRHTSVSTPTSACTQVGAGGRHTSVPTPTAACTRQGAGGDTSLCPPTPTTAHTQAGLEVLALGHPTSDFKSGDCWNSSEAECAPGERGMGPGPQARLCLEQVAVSLATQVPVLL